MEKIYLYGASGHALVLSEAISSSTQITYIDDKKEGKYFNGNLIKGPSTISQNSNVIISIGDNLTRKKLSKQISCKFATAIASSAIVSPSAKIGEGSAILQGAIIQAEANIGMHTIINSGASIDHECKISNYVHISPHATLCGNVQVGEGTWIGAGTTIIQGIKIGKWCIIAAGSVVTKDIPDFSLAAGNRCQVIKTLPVKE